jgi:tungstate transport system ATP-binding protein
MNIEVNNVTKKYNNNLVLNVPNMKFESGKIHGIIGSNGSGKSTLLKIISNIEPPTTGNVLYDKKNINANILKKITYAYQFPYLLKSSVFNNIAYPLKIRKHPKEVINKKVKKILDDLMLNNLKDKYAVKLSGGESQKVAFARAVVFEPSVILLDEPTSNMDLKSIEIIEKYIKEINRLHKTTIFFVTHNISQAYRLCHNISYIENGHILETGSSEEIVHNCKHPSVKKFLSLQLDM